MSIVRSAVLAFLVTAAAQAEADPFERVAFAGPRGEPINLTVRQPPSATAQSWFASLFPGVRRSSDPLRPLVMIDWGDGSDRMGLREVEAALRDTGFVTATIEPSRSGLDESAPRPLAELVDYPLRLKLAVDFMLKEWAGRKSLDASAIFAIGRAMGGFAALVGMGAAPDGEAIDELCWTRRVSQCSRGSTDPADRQSAGLSVYWIHTPALVAAVVLDPGHSAAFSPRSLSSVRGPVLVGAAPIGLRGGEGRTIVGISTSSARLIGDPHGSEALCSRVCPDGRRWICDDASTGCAELADRAARFLAQRLVQKSVRPSPSP